MGILVNRPGVGFVDARDQELDRKLREGDGVGWPGDPDLWLGYGVVQALKPGYDPTGRWRNRGDIIARRYEVWRHCEDGEDRLIGHWRMEERDRILFDLARMRVEAPGHVDVTERIDKANAEIEDKSRRKFRDAYGTMLDHLARLIHDRTQPKNIFRGIPGLRDTRGD